MLLSRHNPNSASALSALACLFIGVAAPACAERRNAVLHELGIELVSVPGGSFRMGSVAPGADGDERPVVTVEVRAFRLMREEVTVAQYQRYLTKTGKARSPKPKFVQGDSHPVVNVSFNDAKAFAAWLKQETGIRFRLPTEAEWEFAVRSGHADERPSATVDSLCDYANGFDEAGRDARPDFTGAHLACRDGFAATAPVASLKANALGLYDMLGNVWEWTEDCYYPLHREPEKGTARSSAAVIGPAECRHVIRGGSWADGPDLLRYANRYWATEDARSDDLGFRLAAEP